MWPFRKRKVEDLRKVVSQLRRPPHGRHGSLLG